MYSHECCHSYHWCTCEIYIQYISRTRQKPASTIIPSENSSHSSLIPATYTHAFTSTLPKETYKKTFRIVLVNMILICREVFAVNLFVAPCTSTDKQGGKNRKIYHHDHCYSSCPFPKYTRTLILCLGVRSQLLKELSFLHYILQIAYE